MSKKKKIYIAGQMAGLEEKEYKKLFNEAERKLRKEGYEVMNPSRFEHATDDWGVIMIQDLNVLRQCSAIYMLSNWKSSNGATIEFKFASAINLEIIFENEDYED